MCRQALAEFGLGMDVISSGTRGEADVKTVGELLPNAFTNKDLE
jgi:cytidine deaminase